MVTHEREYRTTPYLQSWSFRWSGSSHTQSNSLGYGQPITVDRRSLGRFYQSVSINSSNAFWTAKVSSTALALLRPPQNHYTVVVATISKLQQIIDLRRILQTCDSLKWTNIFNKLYKYIQYFPFTSDYHFVVVHTDVLFPIHYILILFQPVYCNK